LEDILQPVTVAAVVLSLLGGLLYALRKRGMAALPSFTVKHNAARQMKVVERMPLSAQHALHLVRVGEKVILVATAPGSCRILDTVPGDRS
jgi:flagellar biogenesis protein FliO